MKRGYGYFDNIRCIEEIAPDFIKKMRGQIDTLSAYRETDQQYFNYFQEREERTIDYDFRTLAHSVKKSLIRIFPKHEPEILSVDTTEGAYSLEARSTDQLLISGARALVTIYLALKFWRDCYYADQKEYAKARLSDMERAVKDYALDVHDMSQMLRGSQGGRATKKPMRIIQAIKSLIQSLIVDEGHDIQNFKAAELSRVLWDHFKVHELRIDGYLISFDHGTDKLIQLKAEDRKTLLAEIAFERFKKHVSAILKEMK